MGYGFVQLESFIDAQKAMKKVNGSEFQGTHVN